MTRQCQAELIRDENQEIVMVRCKKAAQATWSGIDLCTTHLGAVIRYGQLFYRDATGQMMELTAPKQYPLRKDQP
jgi:hypothetical protein